MTAPISATLATALVMLALAALALAIGAMLALRAANARRDVAEELRVLRARDQAIEQVLDVWLWHSDAAHRLVALRPPHGAAAGDWTVARAPALLWECFKPDDSAALQARLGSGAVLDDVPVVLGTAEAGLLRGRAIADATGCFAGYHGTWRARPVLASVVAPVSLSNFFCSMMNFRARFTLRWPVWKSFWATCRLRRRGEAQIRCACPAG